MGESEIERKKEQGHNKKNMVVRERNGQEEGGREKRKKIISMVEGSGF